MNPRLILPVIGLLCSLNLSAQQQRWQQRVSYQMDIDMDVKTNQFKGKQRLILYNNSNERLDKVFYHLYFNAFQPNSMMDMRSRTVNDPDMRVADRISKLRPDEIGYQIVRKLTHNGQPVRYETNETILEVSLDKPIAAGGVDTFEMEFEAQVPLQIRRSGRDNAEGIRLSMSQWYPKMCNFDEQGWHSNPYVGREFYGIWGDFNVNISIDKDYILGGSGYLLNKNEVGYGYEDVGTKIDYNRSEKVTWKFYAPNVHDFVWAADPDYLHDVVELNDTIQLHFLYQDNPDYKETWKKSQDYLLRAFKIIQPKFGLYPYRQYSFIQGGDGGMEYPMATLITGKRNLGSLVGVMVHELMHNWYQMLMGTNEALYAWMDEGFTSYATDIVVGNLFNPNPTNNGIVNIHDGSYKGYLAMVEQKIEEPLSTHADHFISNTAYGNAAYSKGCVFLHQLEYVIGEKALAKTLLDYYNQWRFKHPNPNDFIRVAEKASGLELDWYREYFVNTVHYVDYAVREVIEEQGGTKISLEMVGRFPMPLDLVVEYEQDGKKAQQLFYIPIDLMRGEKADEGLFGNRTILPDWRWTHPKYELQVNIPASAIRSVTIDPSLRLADFKRGNNSYIPPKR